MAAAQAVARSASAGSLTAGSGRRREGWQAYGADRTLMRAGTGVPWRAIATADLCAELWPGSDTERLLAARSRVPLDALGEAKAGG